MPAPEALVQKAIEIFGAAYETEVLGQSFVWRPLTRGEYRALASSSLSPPELEEAVCRTCVLWPEGYDFSSGPAGVPTSLAREILEKSGFPVDGGENPLVRQWLEAFREEMRFFEAQVDCIIVEAFPHLRLEEVANWTVEKTLYYLSRAEWVLSQLRGIPLIDVRTGRRTGYPQLPPGPAEGKDGG